MRKKEFTIELSLYCVALIISIAIRFIGLGEFSLSENEALIANQSLNLFSKTAVLSASSLSLLLTGITFSIFGSTAFWARFFTALFGSLIPVFPFFFKNKIGKLSALILSFILAIDPISIAASRKLGSPIFTIFFLLVSITLLFNKKWKLSTIALAAFSLTGAQASHGIVIAFIFFTIYYVVSDKKDNFTFELDVKQIGQYFGIFILFLLILSSVFFIAPNGISNMMNGIMNWFSGWGSTQEISISRLLLSLPIYAPLILIFGLITIYQAFKKDLIAGKNLALFSAIALFLTILYPNRKVFDLLWATIPLSILSAISLGQLHSKIENKNAEKILSLGLVIFGFFLAFNVSALAKNDYIIGSNQFVLQLAIIGVVIILMILSILMVAAGWSSEAAKKGSKIAILFLLIFYSFAIGWRGTHDPERVQAELWNEGLSANEAYLFTETMMNMSERAIGTKNGVPVELRLISQSLKWELRNQSNENLKNIKFIVTPNTNEVENLTEEYRGQSFSIQSFPIFNNQSIETLLDWLVYREIPYYQQEIILWVPQVLFE